MKCPLCGRENPDDRSQCAFCGSPLPATAPGGQSMSRQPWHSRVPGLLWIPLILLGVAAVVVVPAAFIWGISHIEGLATVIVVAGGVAAFTVPTARGTAWRGLMAAGAIVFFALMGMAIDQPGNPVLNKPLEWAA